MTFFMAELNKADECKRSLEAKITQLESDLQNEKNYNMKLFVNEQTAQMCQRAYFSYKQVETENALKEAEQKCSNEPDSKLVKEEEEKGNDYEGFISCFEYKKLDEEL